MDSEEAPQGQNKLEKCPNCEFSPLVKENNFCPSCGQKCKEKRTTLWSLIKDAFADVFNLDNKLWQTTLNVFIPGKLTNEFFIGRHRRYISPLRFFFITSIAFFAVVQLVTLNVFESDVNEEEKDAFLTHLKLESDSLRADSSFLEYEPSFVLDSLYERMDERYNDTLILKIGDLINQDSTAEINITEQGIENLSKDDFIASAKDGFLKKYGDGGFWEDLISKQIDKLQNGGANFWSYLLGKLAWMMLIMIPLLAIFFKLLYIRRGFYYVDHIIFFFHTHAFTFIIFSFIFLFVNYFPDNDALDSIISAGNIGLALYYFVAMYKVYKQSRKKTFAKLCLVTFFYFFLLILAIILTALISALIY